MNSAMLFNITRFILLLAVQVVIFNNFVTALKRSVDFSKDASDEKATKISDLINPETNAHRHEQEELFADALRMMVISPELAKRLAPNLFERLSKHGLGDNEHQSIAEAYHDAKSKGIENDWDGIR